jgi:hypothetical protein
MANLLKSFKKLYSSPRQETRRHPRYSCFIRVYYLVQGSWYRGSIQNVSEGGLYIRSFQEGKFSTDDPILMLVEFGVLRHQIRGKIIRVESDGIGVEFETSEPEYSALKALLADHCLL